MKAFFSLSFSSSFLSSVPHPINLPLLKMRIGFSSWEAEATASAMSFLSLIWDHVSGGGCICSSSSSSRERWRLLNGGIIEWGAVADVVVVVVVVIVVVVADADADPAAKASFGAAALWSKFRSSNVGPLAMRFTKSCDTP